MRAVPTLSPSAVPALLRVSLFPGRRRFVRVLCLAGPAMQRRRAGLRWPGAATDSWICGFMICSELGAGPHQFSSFSLVVEHSLRKREAVGSIPTGSCMIFFLPRFLERLWFLFLLFFLRLVSFFVDTSKC